MSSFRVCARMASPNGGGREGATYETNKIWGSRAGKTRGLYKQ